MSSNIMHFPLHTSASRKSWPLFSCTRPQLTEADPDEETVVDDDTDTRIKQPWKVILFNDEIHSFEEVIIQLQKATGYTLENAEQIALEAHFKGKAVAYQGDFQKCFKVMGILREIQLIVEIEG